MAKLAVVLVVLLASGAAAAAQDLPKFDTGENDPFAGLRPQSRTAIQQIADRLKLDQKTQLPALEQIAAEARKDAAPIAQQMIQLRQQIVNLELSKKPPELKTAVDAYASAAQQMAGIEARAFAKIYAILKPSQRSNATQAFALMAGMFQPSMSAAGGRGRRGGDGR